MFTAISDIDIRYRYLISTLASAISSATLLIVSFPNFNQPWCAWIALVPWLLLVRGAKPRAAFWWSYVIGLLFFLGSLWWLIHVTLVGWLVLCAFLALYFGLFGLIASHAFTFHIPRFTFHIVIAAAWVALEYARSHLLSGFGWNLLAYSQTPWKPVIQIADVTGAWGVSFLIVLVNSGIAEVIDRAQQATGNKQQGRPRYAFAWQVIAPIGLTLSAVLGYGAWRLAQPQQGPVVRVAVVQGNVPQEEKWDEAHQERIVQRYESLTRQAAQTQPQLIVWPETSVPGYLGLDESVTQRVTQMAASVGVPLLVGAPTGWLDGARWYMANSAVLLDERGAIRQQYNKLRLVPFGEFVPFERVVPWLRAAVPQIGDFTPGKKSTLFHLSLERADMRFGTLICFEDIFPELARRSVRQGANALLVITNDAWFGPTAAAYQHAQASTFRAVELRVPVMRAANTGWSGCIDSRGAWIGSVHNAQGKELFVEGTHLCEVSLGTEKTLALRWGDWFALLSLLGFISWFSFRVFPRPQ